MSSYLIIETIPEDILLEISLYSDTADLVEVYKLFEPKLYEKISFWYTMYSVNFPDVDWKSILPDQRSYDFKMLYIIYERFRHAYYTSKPLFNKGKNIFFNIDNIKYNIIVKIKLDSINNLYLLKFNYQNDFYKILDIFYGTNDKVIINIKDQKLKLIELLSENFWLYIARDNQNFLFIIGNLGYKISYPDVINMIVYGEFYKSNKYE